MQRRVTYIHKGLLEGETNKIFQQERKLIFNTVQVTSTGMEIFKLQQLTETLAVY